MSTPAPALRLSNVSFRYRRHASPALNGLDAVFPSGRTAILGPNGAGKSTLLGIISGMLKRSTGAITLSTGNGSLTVDDSLFRTEIGLMPQQPEFIPNLTAKEHLIYAGWLTGLSQSAAKAESEAWLHRVNLRDHAEKRCGELSGGMKKRLAFASANIGSPALLLLDEPTAGLDPHQRSVFRDIVLDTNPDTIVLIATHQVDDLPQLVEHVAVISHDSLTFLGAVDEFVGQKMGASPTLSELEQAYTRYVLAGEMA